MKQLLLILSGILFLCSCEDMEPTMQGTLEKLEGNTATLKISLPDSISSNEYEILSLDLANNKDAFLNTPLRADGENHFIYIKNSQTQLSKILYNDVIELQDNYGNAKFIVIILSILFICLTITTYFKEEDTPIKKGLLTTGFITVSFIGISYLIGILNRPSEVSLTAYGKLVAHTPQMSIIEVDGEKKIYYKLDCSVCLGKCSMEGFNGKSTQVGIINKQLNFCIYPSENKEQMEETVKFLNQNNPLILQKFRTWLIHENCIVLILILAITIMTYWDKLQTYFTKRKKKKMLEENISEDERHGKGSF